MTTHEAKQVLLAYRPWVTEAPDPETAQALALCRTDVQLGRWFEAHCAAQVALREKFGSIRAPEGLRQQILSERPRLTPVVPARRGWAAVAAGLAILVSGVVIWKTVLDRPAQDLSFNGYRNRMVRTVSRAYGMDVETNNLNAVQAYLASQNAPVGFALPGTLPGAALVGCGVLKWQNKPVTMVCFHTGKTLPPGMKSDLVLFVIDRQDVQGGGADPAKPEFHQSSDWYTASWQSGTKVYLLAALSEAELRARL